MLLLVGRLGFASLPRRSCRACCVANRLHCRALTDDQRPQRARCRMNGASLSHRCAFAQRRRGTLARSLLGSASSAGLGTGLQTRASQAISGKCLADVLIGGLVTPGRNSESNSSLLTVPARCPTGGPTSRVGSWDQVTHQVLEGGLADLVAHLVLFVFASVL